MFDCLLVFLLFLIFISRSSSTSTVVVRACAEAAASLVDDRVCARSDKTVFTGCTVAMDVALRPCAGKRTRAKGEYNELARLGKEREFFWFFTVVF